jgi:hypothetical protein
MKFWPSNLLGHYLRISAYICVHLRLIILYNIDKLADIPYFLDAISFFHIPLYTILDF